MVDQVPCTVKEAREMGFMVDTRCYPWVAYRGPRFKPTEIHEIPTDIEAEVQDLRDSNIDLRSKLEAYAVCVVEREQAINDPRFAGAKVPCGICDGCKLRAFLDGGKTDGCNKDESSDYSSMKGVDEGRVLGHKGKIFLEAPLFTIDPASGEITQVPTDDRAIRNLMWEFLRSHSHAYLKDCFRGDQSATHWREGEPACPCTLCDQARAFLGLHLNLDDRHRYFGSPRDELHKSLRQDRKTDWEKIAKDAAGQVKDAKEAWAKLREAVSTNFHGEFLDQLLDIMNTLDWRRPKAVSDEGEEE